MKNVQKKKRVQLSVPAIDDQILLGLACSDPDYKLSLKINKRLHISLKSTSPVSTTGASVTGTAFARFADMAAEQDSYLRLISNRSGSEFLIRKLKNLDYLIEIYNPSAIYNISDIVSRLREIDTITAVFKVDMKLIKDKGLRYLFSEGSK